MKRVLMLDTNSESSGVLQSISEKRKGKQILPGREQMAHRFLPCQHIELMSIVNVSGLALLL